MNPVRKLTAMSNLSYIICEYLKCSIVAKQYVLIF